MKVLILAGGLGSRLSEETVLKPKPMVEIGGHPILWHIMKCYSYYGFNDFIILTGYKSHVIKDYFVNYYQRYSDLTVDMATNTVTVHKTRQEPWKVTLLYTGQNTMTGGRIKRAQDYINNEPFLLTYGDGVSDLNIADTVRAHEKSGKLVSMTAVNPSGRFGALIIDKQDTVTSFMEKPKGDGAWINGGFFVCQPEVMNYIANEESETFERAPWKKLAQENQIHAYKYDGFWHPMDTLKDKTYLTDLWQKGKSSVEKMGLAMFNNVYPGKRVLITGHSGFKGGWLTLWLKELGATVCGYSLAPNTTPCLFEAVDVADGITSVFGDLADTSLLNKTFQNFQPEIVFHLAAQPLVRLSYSEPVQTYQTNVMGTLNVLEAARKCKSVKAFVNITTDKCYENKEVARGYKEDEPMGGYDMYSSSKGCVEIMSSSYRRSFLQEPDTYALATARAGNVIGGGDWAQDRLIPDCVRSIEAGQEIEIRHPHATRPWQHVLEPLSGYLLLGQKLLQEGKPFAQGFNFGPHEASVLTVADVVQQVIQNYGKGSVKVHKKDNLHEANLLMLNIEKAYQVLGWAPTYSAQQAIAKTAVWYQRFYQGEDMRAFTLTQIHDYEENIPWKKN